MESILGIPVYNISTPAGDIDNYQKLLNYAQRKGAKIGNLIVSVCMENDLKDYEPLTKPPSPRFRGSPPRLRKEHKPKHIFYRRLLRIKAWLAKNSATYHAFAAIMHQNPTLKRMAIKLGLIIDNYAGIHKNIYSDKVITNTVRKLLDLSGPFNTAVVIIPSRALWVGENRSVELAMHNGLISSLKEYNLRVIDLRPYFEGEGNPPQYYFRDDGHWNEKGHQKTAEVIADFLAQNRTLYNLTGH